jgi:hypothetical protein
MPHRAPIVWDSIKTLPSLLTAILITLAGLSTSCGVMNARNASNYICAGPNARNASSCICGGLRSTDSRPIPPALEDHPKIQIRPHPEAVLAPSGLF